MTNLPPIVSVDSSALSPVGLLLGSLGAAHQIQTKQDQKICLLELREARHFPILTIEFNRNELTRNINLTLASRKIALQSA
jgi:hypothetical protein